jgi:uncharacterized protein YjbI with pentapeptide repeats
MLIDFIYLGKRLLYHWPPFNFRIQRKDPIYFSVPLCNVDFQNVECENLDIRNIYFQNVDFQQVNFLTAPSRVRCPPQVR